MKSSWSFGNKTPHNFRLHGNLTKRKWWSGSSSSRLLERGFPLVGSRIGDLLPLATPKRRQSNRKVYISIVSSILRVWIFKCHPIKKKCSRKVNVLNGTIVAMSFDGHDDVFHPWINRGREKNVVCIWTSSCYRTWWFKIVTWMQSLPTFCQM